MRPTYEYALSLTSQFPFCSMPLRLDSYSECQFSCQYCFASARGGSHQKRKIQIADPAYLRRKLSRLEFGNEPRSALDEMLAAKVPIHFGGMTDPFSPIELDQNITYELLKILRDFSYPTVLSTKSTLCAEKRYANILNSPNFVVQVSIPSADDARVSRVDVGVPSPSARVNALKKLSEFGVLTACRIQPLLPGMEMDAMRLIEMCAKAGVRHVSVEHLKLAMETKAKKELSNSLGIDLSEYFLNRGATRTGREWILPAEERIDRILTMKQQANALGMTFGAADSDFLHLSDGSSCCSGVDTLGFKNTYRFTYTQAIKAASNGRVEFANIANAWRPMRSIARYVNSSSRLVGASGIEDYVMRAWNGSSNGASPLMYYGIEKTEEFDKLGFRVYSIENSIKMHIKNSKEQFSYQ